MAQSRAPCSHGDGTLGNIQAASAKRSRQRPWEVPGVSAIERSLRARAGLVTDGVGPCLILENCAGLSTLYKRTLVHGRVFKTHELDVTYPATGPAQFTLEAKVLGTPLHPGNVTSQTNALGRGASADLDKRLKEAAFKAIDLKAEYDLLVAGEGGTSQTGPGHASMTSWLRQQLPSTYSFLAVRCIDETDRDRVMLSATAVNQVFDHVGVYCFGPIDEHHPTSYRTIPVRPNAYEIGHVLQEACRDLRAIESRIQVHP
jgi:hypothetical protein